MAMIKSEDRQAEIVAHAKQFKSAMECDKWNQELNALCIIDRVVAMLKRNSIPFNPAFIKDLTQDALCEGSGLYGNASQFGQAIDGKKAGKASEPDASARLAAMCARYDVPVAPTQQ